MAAQPTGAETPGAVLEPLEPRLLLAVNSLAFPQQVVDVGKWPTAIASGDFNGDGRADLVVTNHYDGDVSVLYGLPGGGFGEREDVDVGGFLPGIVSGDFNGDGRADLAVANYYDNNVSVLYGLSGGGLGARQNVPVGAYPNDIVFGDFDGDGRLDLAVTNYRDHDVSVLYLSLIHI